MYTQKHYYLVDNVSETIIANFFAKNERMARKIISGFDFKKANLDADDCSLFEDPNPVRFYEVYDQVISADFVDKNDLIHQEVLDFDGDSNADAVK